MKCCLTGQLLKKTSLKRSIGNFCHVIFCCCCCCCFLIFLRLDHQKCCWFCHHQVFTWCGHVTPLKSLSLSRFCIEFWLKWLSIGAIFLYIKLYEWGRSYHIFYKNNEMEEDYNCFPSVPSVLCEFNMEINKYGTWGPQTFLHWLIMPSLAQ